MLLIAVKVLLAPALVVCASLAGRRFGARVGGLIGGLPLVAGPILLAYALAHGRAFAAHAARGTLLGLVSLMAFVVVYARLADRRRSWLSALLGGWAAFLACTLAFTVVPRSALLATATVVAALILSPSLLPDTGPPPAVAEAPTRWDLPLRAACALALVLALTALAGRLGPQLSGLLTPFPVIASVLAAFTHGQRGAAELVHLLRGLLVGYLGFAAFCLTLALWLTPLGIAGAFAIACALALACGAASLVLRRRWIVASRAG